MGGLGQRSWEAETCFDLCSRPCLLEQFAIISTGVTFRGRFLNTLSACFGLLFRDIETLFSCSSFRLFSITMLNLVIIMGSSSASSTQCAAPKAPITAYCMLPEASLFESRMLEARIYRLNVSSYRITSIMLFLVINMSFAVLSITIAPKLLAFTNKCLLTNRNVTLTRIIIF